MKEHIHLRFHVSQELELQNMDKGMEDPHEHIEFFETQWLTKAIPQE